jgi:hypothetical protein
MEQPQQVLVNASLIENLRLMLIQLALTESRPPSVRFDAIERNRQFCEGYLGVDRDKLKSMNEAEVMEVLEITGAK